MKRKLVPYEVFAKMKENSLTTAVKELVEAEDHLARILDVDELKLKSFDETTVIYEQSDGSFLKANYSVSKDAVNFDDVEELVIDEETERTASRNIVKDMLEAILDDNEVEANKFFEKYLDMASRQYQRESAASEESAVSEAFARLYGSKERTGGSSSPKISFRSGAKNPNRSRAARKSHQQHKASYQSGARKRHRNVSQERSRRPGYKKHHNKLRALTGGQHYTGKRKKMTEWQNVAGNVFSYIDFMDNGHVISEAKVQTNDNGTLAVQIPTSKVRNEGKVLKMHFDKMLKTDVKVLRESARRLIADPRFCQMVADIKRFNNISDSKELEESIGSLIKDFPAVLYLTQEELAKVVGMSLDNSGVTNYDDRICTFMAEGILRAAHNAYTDRVDRILKLANKTELKESDDKYLDFQVAVTEFFPTLDESTHLEMKMFEDLYNVAVDIRRIALESDNDVIRNEAQEFIGELENVLSGKMLPSLELAADVAGWLEDLAEANLPGAGENWGVVKTPHYTTTGDHPQMAKNAKVDGVPSKYPGDWGDSAPMIGQDSNTWNHGEEARNKSWSNKGGKDAWPDLKNPYIPTPFGDYKIKGETSPEDENNDFGGWSDGDTWPNLQNPYVPKALVPRQKVQPDNPVE